MAIYLLRMWHFFQLSLFFSVMLLTSAYGAAGEAGTVASAKPQLRIGYLAIVSHLPVVLAYGRDRYNLQQSSVRVYRYQSYTGLEAALRVGGIDMAIMPGPIVLSMATDGVPVRILAALSSGGSRLYRRARVDNDTTFRNLTIGVPGLDSMEHIGITAFYSSMGLQYGLDYRTFGVGMSSAIEEVRQGKIDAFFLPEPLPSVALASHIDIGGNIIPIAGEETYNKSLLVVREEMFGPEMMLALKEWLVVLQRATLTLADDLRNGEVTQAAITQAEYFFIPRQTMESILKDSPSYLRFGYEQVTLEYLRNVMAGMNLIGLQGGDERIAERVLVLPGELVDLF